MARVKTNHRHIKKYLMVAAAAAALFVSTRAGWAGPPELYASPNPTKGPLLFTVVLEKAGQIRILVFDVRGRLTAKAVDTFEVAGVTGYRWNAVNSQGNRVVSGWYTAVLQANGETARRRFQVVR
jgi:hypothetical protein